MSKMYYVYKCSADAWTQDMDRAYDYIKVCGNEIFFISRKKQNNYEELREIPEALLSWITSYELALANNATKPKLKRAVKKLEEDFKSELESALTAGEQAGDTDG